MAVAAPTATRFSFIGTSNSTSVTLDASCNLLVAFVTTRNQPTSISATYNGVSLIDVGAGLVNAGTLVYAQAFYLTNPSTGANTFATTLGAFQVCIPVIYGLSGADTTTPFRSQTGPQNYLRSALNPGTNPTITLAGSVGDLAIDAVQLPANTDTTLTATGANSEAISQLRDSSGGNFERVGGSSAAGGASVTMSWSQGISQAVQQIGVMVAAGSAPTVFPTLSLLGVGC